MNLSLYKGTTMNDTEIQMAVNAIMRLRPEPKPDTNAPTHRMETKRRMDELTYQRELADIKGGNLPSRKVDFFAPGKSMSSNATSKAVPLHINNGKTERY